MPLVRSKVALAMIGTLVAGAFGAAVGAWSAPHGSTQAAQSSSALSPVPTSTPSPPPTATPAPPSPTATAIVTSTTTVRGRVVSIGTNSINCRESNGTTVTVTVTSATVWTGAANSLAQVRSGQRVNAQGATTDGQFVATSVNIQNDN